MAAERAHLETIERIGDPETGTQPASGNAPPWRNKLIFGDNLAVLQSLLHGPLRAEIESRGGLRLIYIDPPFDVGTNFCQELALGEGRVLRRIAYRDKWAGGEFEAMIYERLRLMRDLLADDGCIYVHCDWRFNARMRLLLDDLFKFHINEIIWHYTGGGRSRNYFSRKHDTIFIYSKNGKFVFNRDALRIAYSKTSGYAKSGIVSKAGKRYLPHPAGKLPDDVWDIPIVNPLSNERVAYPTQKPEALLERIVLASSRKDDLIADFFCGSGTLAAVAQRLGRRWIACDNGAPAIHTTRKRLIEIMEKRGGPGFDLLADVRRRPCPAPLAAPGLRPEEGRRAAFSRIVPIGIGLRAHRKEHLAAVELTGYTIFETLAWSNLAIEHGQLFETGAQRRQLTETWMDWIDYWAVDYDWNGAGVFKNGWQAFRGKKRRKLELVSGWRPVTHGRLAVKVVDILGNESLGEIALGAGF